MPRGITEHDVFAAADALLARGARPTIERVRQELGRGSPNTVNRILDLWWAGLADRLREVGSPKTDAPKAVIELANKIWQQIMPMAQAQATKELATEHEGLATLRRELDAQAASLAAHERSLKAQIQTLETQKAVLDAKLEARNADVDTQVRANDELKRTLASKDKELAAQSKKLGELQATIEKLKERLEGNERFLQSKLAEEKLARESAAREHSRRIEKLQRELEVMRISAQDMTDIRTELRLLGTARTKKPPKSSNGTPPKKGVKRSKS